MTEFKKNTNQKMIPKAIQFDYRTRGFYCPECHIGLTLTRKDCPNCGQVLSNPYEGMFKND